MMVEKDSKATLQTLYTDAVTKVVSHGRNGRPPPISNSEKDLTRKERSTPAQLRSCGLLGSYKSRIKKDTSLNVCAYYGMTPHDVKGDQPTTMTASYLWSTPADAVRELGTLKARDPD